MKLCRYGKNGFEKPGMIDADGKLRDLSKVVGNIGPNEISPRGLKNLARIKPETLPVVAGNPRHDADEIRGKQGRGEDGRRALVDEDEPGVEAVTRYKVLRRFAHAAELEVELGTGRTHQVRVALAAIGCPVLGDRVYAKGNPHARAARLMLHAHTLEVDHPRTGSRLRVESPLPALFRQVLAELQA